MEHYKSRCLDCGAVYNFLGDKTDIEKNKRQLLEIAHADHTCIKCGSKALITGLDWGNDKILQDYNADPSILTDNEKRRAQEVYNHIDVSNYECKHCNAHDVTVISKWVDTDGEFILLYCMECHKRFATEFKK